MQRTSTVRGRSRVLLGFAAFGAFWGTWGASLPRVQSHAGVSDADLGVALLWVGAGALGSIRWAGGLSDRFDRAMVAASIAALALAGILPAFVHGVLALSASMLVMGACSGAVDAAINAAAIRSEAAGCAVVSLAHGVFSVAVVISSLGVAVASRGAAGRPWSLVAVAAVLLIAALLSTRLTTASPGRRAVPAESRRSWSWPLLIIGGLAALAYLVENAWQSWGAIHLHTTIGASLAVAALAPAVFAGAAAAGRFGGHVLSGALSASTLFATGAATAGAGSALAALAPSTTLVLIGIGVAGLGTSVCAPTLIALAGRATPNSRGAATGTIITIAYLGFVLGPAAVGLLAGAATLPVALASVAIVAAGLCGASPLLPKLSAGVSLGGR